MPDAMKISRVRKSHCILIICKGSKIEVSVNITREKGTKKQKFDESNTLFK